MMMKRMMMRASRSGLSEMMPRTAEGTEEEERPAGRGKMMRRKRKERKRDKKLMNRAETVQTNFKFQDFEIKKENCRPPRSQFEFPLKS